MFPAPCPEPSRDREEAVKPEVRIKEIADLERRVSSLEGEVRALASLVRDLASRPVPPPPFILKPPCGPETPVEKILGPRIT